MGVNERSKEAKRTLNFYRQAYLFREPYQIIGNFTFLIQLVDAPFLEAALQQRTNLIESLQLLLGSSSVKLMTTDCIRAEMKLADKKKHFGAFVASKRYELIRACKHRPILSGCNCIKELLERNVADGKFFVATHDPHLKEILRLVPGIPIIFNHHGKIFLEVPTQSSVQQSKKSQHSKLLPSEQELVTLQQHFPLQPKQQPPIRKKRKGPKRPNPLSCKKKAIKK